MVVHEVVHIVRTQAEQNAIDAEEARVYNAIWSRRAKEEQEEKERIRMKKDQQIMLGKAEFDITWPGADTFNSNLKNHLEQYVSVGNLDVGFGESRLSNQEENTIAQTLRDAISEGSARQLRDSQFAYNKLKRVETIAGLFFLVYIAGVAILYFIDYSVLFYIGVAGGLIVSGVDSYFIGAAKKNYASKYPVWVEAGQVSVKQVIPSIEQRIPKVRMLAIDANGKGDSCLTVQLKIPEASANSNTDGRLPQQVPAGAHTIYGDQSDVPPPSTYGNGQQQSQLMSSAPPDEGKTQEKEAIVLKMTTASYKLREDGHTPGSHRQEGDEGLTSPLLH